MFDCERNGASRRCISRSASPTRMAASYIDGTFQIVSWSGRLWWRSRMLVTPWVIARFPDDSTTITRSSFFSYTRIFVNVSMWSTPALVRESDAKIMPLSRRRAQQYVIWAKLGPRLRGDDWARSLLDGGGGEEAALDLGREVLHGDEESGQVFVQAAREDVGDAPVLQP